LLQESKLYVTAQNIVPEFTDVVFIHITDNHYRRYHPYVTVQNTVQLAEFTDDVVFIHITTDNDYQRYQPYVTAQNIVLELLTTSFS